MKKVIYKWLYQFVDNVLSYCIDNGERLTPRYLEVTGLWYKDEQGYYYEPDIKDRDKIYIKFERHYYRVWHGPDRTFVALESTREWFEVYYRLMRREW